MKKGVPVSPGVAVAHAHCVDEIITSHEPYTPVPVENADRCDFLDPAVCLQPFPNDYFTVNDSSTATGKRLNLNPESMPANTSGVHIDPTDINRADGFSPGNLITVKIPGLDTPAAFENTGLVAEDDLHVPSVTGPFPTVDWHERETYDFFGVVFDGHPNLRRILLPEGWEGWPLRKTEELGGVDTRYHGAFMPPVDRRTT